MMDIVFQYIKCFCVGGLICILGQILLDCTKLTNGKIMVAFLLMGALLQALGLYQPIVDFAGAGATVPISGFGYALAKGAIEEVGKKGIMGALTGGLTATASGITVAIVFGYLAALVASPKSKS